MEWCFFQILTIIISRGQVDFLANLYAFGVIWSFAMKGVAVLVLRYTHPGHREYRVPLNITIGGVEIPLGLGMITLVLLGIAIVNSVHQVTGYDCRREFFLGTLSRVHDFGKGVAPPPAWRTRGDGPVQSGAGKAT